MKITLKLIPSILLFGTLCLFAQGSNDPVPRVMKYSGTLKDRSGKVLSGTQAVNFLIYKDRTGGTALWMETQNVQVDSSGAYTVMVGGASEKGLPLDLFLPGETRWLATRIVSPDEEESARVQLVSVPFALKASDADTLGGLPLSAFLLRDGATSASPGGILDTPILPAPASQGTQLTTKQLAKSNPHPKTTTQGHIPAFSNNSGSLTDTSLTQDGFGNIGLGLGTASPAALFHIEGTYSSVAVTLRNGSNPAPVQWCNEPTTNCTYMMMWPPTGGLFLGPDLSNAISGLTVGQLGNVGIGTRSPQARLDVSGDIFAGYNTANTARVIKTFPTAHSAANVPSQVSFGITDGADVAGMQVYDARQAGQSYNDQYIGFYTQHGGISAGVRVTIDRDGNLWLTGTTNGANNGIYFPDGTFQNTAAGALSFSAEHAATLKSQGETIKQLQSENAALNTQMAELRAEIESLKKLIGGPTN